MRDWTRKQMNPGTEFRTAGDRLVVKQVDDPRRPGAPARPGWGVYVDGSQIVAAFSSAKKAMAYTEENGVVELISATLRRNTDRLRAALLDS